MPNSRRNRLREATASSHRTLDAQASALEIATFGGYARFLLAHAAALNPIEVTLEQQGVASWLTDWNQRRRRHHLAEDLRSLNRTSHTIGAIELPTLSDQLGALYVLEGSRLGTQVIAKQVDRSNDPRVLAARRFLNASGATHWHSFVRILEAVEAVDEARMIGAALRTFEVYRTAFANSEQLGVAVAP